MKKTVTAIILLIAVTVLQAQREKTNSFNFGIKGGGSLSLFLGETPFDIHPKLYLGFATGIYSNYTINRKLSIQSEILYSMKGSNFKEFTYKFMGIEAPSINLYSRTNWIEFLLLGMYRVNDKFILSVGPYLGIYLNGDIVIKRNLEIASSMYPFYIDSDISAKYLNLPDYGIVLDAAYNITKNICIRGRLEQGIRNLVRDNILFFTYDYLLNFIEEDFVSIYNSSFQLQLDYSF